MSNAAELLQREAQAWVVRLDSGGATADDARAFRAWCAQSREHANAFTQARGVWQQMSPAARQLMQGDARRRASRRPLASTGRRAFLGGAVAASVAYLAWRPPLGWWPSVGELAADYHTATGEQRTLALADGVQLQLNTQTRVNVPAPGAGREAAVELLQGEAQIAAAASQRVIVRAGGGEVAGQGASFNVRHTDGTVCVTCLRGRITVARAGRDATLESGQQLVYGERGISAAQPVDATAVMAWRRRLLVFHQVPLGEVVAEVNRYRTGRLILGNEALAQTRVQASISLDRLDDVVALIRDVYGASVTRLPGGIVLFGMA
ncbi:FecR family protein [Herbaspirillum robiniae]|nr:FecR domain-containing protein [Herbaspirillum robiniae]